MIDTEALRKKVINLAIQGKLTKRLPEDGNAEDLYAQIQKEKAKLAKEGRIKKEKSLPEISDDEIPFEIPSNWKWCRLGEVYCVLMGQSPDGMNVGVDIDGIEFHQGKIYFGEKFLNQSVQKTCELTRIANANSVLLCVRAPVGVVNITERQICIGRGLCALTAIAGMEPLYLFYYLLSCRKSFEQSGTGSTFSSITVDVVKKHIVPLPPIEEQRRIVSLLDKVFDQFTLIDDLQHKFESDREIMKGKIIDAGIHGKLTEQLSEDGDADDLYAQIQEEKARLIKEGKLKKEKPFPAISEDEIPFEIPKNWKWVRLRDICSFMGGYAYKSELYIDYSDNQIIRLGNVKQNHLLLDAKPVFISNELANETEEYRIKENDVLVTMTGTKKRKDYFFAVRVNKEDLNEKNLYLNQRVGCIRTIGKQNISFLVTALQNTEIRNHIFEYETGAVNQGNLGSNDIQSHVIIPFPPLSEQKRIAEKIDSILALLSLRH